MDPHLPDSPSLRRAAGPLAVGLVALSLLVVGLPDQAGAAGFEVGETTTLSLARGGTGVAGKRDPSALYFNPALLPRANGVQVLTDTHVVDFNLEFDRADLVYRKNRREQRKTFDKTVTNLKGPQPLPAAAVSWDFGMEDLTAAAGIFTPSAYGEKCYGRLEDGECKVDADGPARYLLVSSKLVEFYASAGVGYQIDLPDQDGTLSVGATGIYAYQDNDFTLVINSEPAPTSPYEEDPKNDAVFKARNLTGHNVLGIFGIAYENDGLRLGASYRPPISWNSEGTADVDFPESLANFNARLSDDAVTFRANQAGSLRLGFAYEDGQHPGFEDRPRYNIEVNGTWENWSAVDQFELEPAGDVESDAAGFSIDRIVQPWNWRDTFSLRVGGSWGAGSWLTLHGGGMLESAAQPAAYTHPAFPSWERYAGSLGASLHPWPWMDIKLAFMHIGSPDRSVDDGRINQIVPASSCKGPDYDDDACNPPGTPPGNPQNEGEWSVNYNIASLGLTFRFD